MKKWVVFVCIWVSIAIIGFWAGISGIDYNLRFVDSSLKKSKNVRSYTFDQRFGSDNKLITRAEGRSTADPTQTYILLSAPIEFQQKNFDLEVYEAKGNIYLHPRNESAWYKTDFAHPAIKQLDPLFHPFDLWEEMLQDVDHVEKVQGSSSSLITYRLVWKEKPQIALYHLMLHDVKQLDVTLSMEPDTQLLREAIAHIELEDDDIMAQSTKVDYIMRFSDLNHSLVPSLPEEASKVENLK